MISGVAASEVVEVMLYGLVHPFAHGYDTVLVALALTNEDKALIQVDVGGRQAASLAASQATTIVDGKDKF